MGCVRTHWIQFDHFNGEWICAVNMAMKLLDTVRDRESLDNLNAGFSTSLPVVY
jgi:hypothetical protein